MRVTVGKNKKIIIKTWNRNVRNVAQKHGAAKGVFKTGRFRQGGVGVGGAVGVYVKKLHTQFNEVSSSFTAADKD